MVNLLPPQLAGNDNSYLHAYNGIISAHRRSPLTSASSVILLVAPDVDAICAARMLAMLFKQDDIGYRIIPVCENEKITEIVADLENFSDLHTLLLINMGNMLDIPREEYFGRLNLKVTIHVIDSSRPISLTNFFLGGENGNRVLIWNDEDPFSKYAEERKAWEVLEYDPEPDQDEEEDSDDEIASVDSEEEYSQSESGTSPHKRKNGDREHSRKRRKLGEDRKYDVEERQRMKARIDKYYTGGSWYAQSAASTVYILATMLERVDNDFLWLAILGLTYQYITSRISRDKYELYHSIYFDEVSRLNLNPGANDNAHSLISVNPDDTSVRASDELRFMLFRHWTLYDAMFHSSYVASKLGIWKERGRQKLTGLLAKMGFSIPQTQQPYSHMDMDLKRSLIQKLNDIAPEYGLIELSYPSFMRCQGFHSQPFSAADAVEGIRALLDVAFGMRMEVEIEGMRNGGEWFGSGRLWDSNRTRHGTHHLADEADKHVRVNENEDPKDAETPRAQETEWWVKNFWMAYDALSDITLLRDSLNLSMSLQRAIIRQGTSIIDKQDIRTTRNHRVVVMAQGPDLALFSHPGVLGRLAAWLVDALRDRLPGTTVGRSKKKSLPLVIACLDEAQGEYTVIGLMGALDFNQVRRNEFTYTFLNTARRSNAGAYYTTFESNILRVPQKNLKIFLDLLCQ